MSLKTALQHIVDGLEAAFGSHPAIKAAVDKARDEAEHAETEAENAAELAKVEAFVKTEEVLAPEQDAPTPAT